MNKNKRRILWICIILALLLLGGIAAFFWLQPGKTGKKHTVHNFSDTQIIRPVSCAQDGITAHACSCGKEQLEIIPATGHSFSSWHTEKEPSCTDTGSKSMTCSLCMTVQTEVLPPLEHSYAQLEAGIDNTTLQYECTACADTFGIDAAQEVDLYNARYHSDCDENYTFRVYCRQGEEYIRQHLYIADAYYHNTDNQVNLEYRLSGGYNGYWTVSPVTPYTAGNIYIASRSGEVLFEDMTVRDMKFQIYREESEEIVLNDEVKFLQSMENRRAGYYPYDLQHMEETNTYWLKLEKATGLTVGDIICVGDATCLEDVMSQTGDPDVFGKISYIGFDETQHCYCLELVCPELSELFSSLNIYSRHATMLGEPSFTSGEQLIEQTSRILYQSEDFARLMCAVQDTSVTYLSARGYATPLSSVEDFFHSIEIREEDCELPYIDDNGIISAKIVLGGEVSIPVTLTRDSDEQLGEIKFYFTATVSLDSMQVLLSLEDSTVSFDGVEQPVKAQIGVDQQVTVSFTMGAEVQMDWSLSSRPYAINKKNGKLHFATCKHVAAMKNPEEDLEMMTSEDFFSKLADEELHAADECKTCQPVSGMLSDSLVINTQTNIVHLPTCTQAKQLKAPKAEISDLPLANLLAQNSQYRECENCQPSNRTTNSFSEQVLENMRSKDLGENLNTFRQMADEAADSAGASTLSLATASFTVTGIDVIELQLGVYFDFNLEATLEYNYQLQTNSQYGLYLDSNGFSSYSDSREQQKRNDLTLTGKVRVDLGLQAAINLHMVGVEKYCHAQLTARAGMYAELHGAAQLDFMSSRCNYASAYFEAGLHLDLLGQAKLFLWETGEQHFLPEEYQDIPFLRYGFERLYYNFDQVPSEIRLNTIYYNLEDAQLLNVKYYDIVTMESGGDTLNIMGVKGKYSVEFSLKNGSNCTVSDGYLLVNTPNQSFSDELTVTVTGSDKWGKYRNGNTQYNLDSYTIPIYYDAETADPNDGFVPAGGVEYNGHYYKLYVDNAATWEDAKRFCEARGGYLAVISSPEENDALHSYILNAGAQTAYFGLYKDEQGQWTWVDSEESAYFNWADGEPNNEGETERYGEFYYRYTDGSWNDGNFNRGTANDTVCFICEWETYQFAPEHSEDMTVAGRLDALVGYYRGWYTATQGITGGAIGVHRTNALLNDDAALQMYADLATNCAKDSQGNVTVTYTAEDIRQLVSNHTDEYIAIFMFGPLQENPGVEDGLYTMTVEYDEASGTYTLKGKEWIQHDTYVFVDVAGLTLGGKTLLGSVCMDSIWSGYTQIGELFQECYIPSFESAA